MTRIGAVVVALIFGLLPIGIAQAELFGAHDRSWGWDDYEPFGSHHHRSWGGGDYERLGQRHPRAHKSSKPEQKEKFQEPVKGPLQIVVSIADQRISIYDDGKLIARSLVSTGVQGHPTPIGVFSVIGKELWHRSNIYSAAPMPYMQRITWSGIALHAGVLPGHPASHGCIRLVKDFAVRLWRLTKRGTRVIIAPNDVYPVQIDNPHLFANPKTASNSPEPSTDPLAEKDVITLASKPIPLMPNGQSGFNFHPTTGSQPQKKVTPISIFVSRKLSKLFVRQRFTALFDAPITIESPEVPLGTHVFTLLHNEGASLRWNVVSLSAALHSNATGSDKKIRTLVQGVGGAVGTDQLPDDPNAVLDRLEIPQEVIGRISQLLTPGSSLIISDSGFSRETGNDTDFIVEIP